MARSGLKTLHDIDSAIAQARKAVDRAAQIPAQVSDNLAEISRRQMMAYREIAQERLSVLEAGRGGELGRTDREAERLLGAHAESLAALGARLERALEDIEAMEARRRGQEKTVNKAIDAYDKAAADAESKILLDPQYMAQVNTVEDLEATVTRAEEKLITAQEDETEKGDPYRKDPFFAYLQARCYGTKDAKGWFLTKLLDGWVASLVNYREAAENYRRLTAIPARLAAHVEGLEEQVSEAKARLEALEDDMLRAEGVTALHEESLAAQSVLDEIDAAIERTEGSYESLREEQAKYVSGEAGPYREAVSVLTSALQRKDVRTLRRLAAQTRSRDDDRAIEDIRDLFRTAEDLKDDQAEAKALLRSSQKTLSELQGVRRNFKNRRYDAPSSVFDQSGLLTALLNKVLAGAISGNDFWRQLQRYQRTVRRYSDNDFGGIDWTEGLRLPRNSGGWGGSFPSSGGWGGGSTRSRRRRTSIPRAPRRSLPRSSGGGGRRSGGFRTGGGF